MKQSITIWRNVCIQRKFNNSTCNWYTIMLIIYYLILIKKIKFTIQINQNYKKNVYESKYCEKLINCLFIAFLLKCICFNK